MVTETIDNLAIGYRAVSNHRQATSWGMVIGTANRFWERNPVGFRIECIRPVPDGRGGMKHGPGIAVLLFWNNQVKTASANYGVKNPTVSSLITGYDFFPSHFTEQEIAQLEGQLRDTLIKIGSYALKSVRKTRG